MKQIILLLGMIITLQILWIINNNWTSSEGYNPYDGLNPKLGRFVFSPQNVLQEYTNLCSQ